MPAVSNNPSKDPNEGNNESKVKSSRRETMAQQRQREEEEERRRKAKEDRELSAVSYGVLEILKKTELPQSGRIRVGPINGFKFRANYYVDHLIVWTKCVTMDANGVIALCSVQ